MIGYVLLAMAGDICNVICTLCRHDWNKSNKEKLIHLKQINFHNVCNLTATASKEFFASKDCWFILNRCLKWMGGWVVEWLLGD